MQINEFLKSIIYFLIAITLTFFIPFFLQKYGLLTFNFMNFINIKNSTFFYISNIIVFQVTLFILLLIFHFFKKRIFTNQRILLHSFSATIRFFSFLLPIVTILLSFIINNSLLNETSSNDKVSDKIFITFFVFLSLLYIVYNFVTNIRRIYSLKLIYTAIILWITFLISSQIGVSLLTNNLDSILLKDKLHKSSKTNSSTIQQTAPEIIQLITSDKMRKISSNNYEYTLSDDQKLELLFLKQSTKKMSKITFDGRDIRNDIVDYNQTHNILKLNYKLKPGQYQMVFINGKTTRVNINIRYLYNLNQSKTNIDKFWYYKVKGFVTVKHDGILLSNNISKHASFGFKRRFEDDISFEFDFIPMSIKTIDMSVFFGERTYFVFNNSHIKAMRKNAANEDESQKSSKYIPFQAGKLYKIRINRQAQRYSIYIDNELKLIYEDISTEGIQNQKFRNVGIALPKGNMSLLLKRIVIK